MADNVAITAGSGTAVATDDVGGVHYQRVKLALGADGDAVDAVAGAGAVSTAVQRVTLASDDPAVVSLAALDNAVSGNELQVDIVTSALPTGASTLAEQQTQTTHLASLVAAVGDEVPGTAGTASVLAGGRYSSTQPTLTDGQQASIQLDSRNNIKVTLFPANSNATMAASSLSDGGAGANVLPAALVGYNGTTFDRLKSDTTNGLDVDVTRSALPTGASTLAEQQSQTTHLSNIATSVGTLDNAISGSEMQVDIVSSALPSGAATEASLADLNSNTFAATKTEDAAHNTGDRLTPMGAVRRDTPAVGSDTDGDYSTINVDSSGRLYVNVNTSALPTGASTLAEQQSQTTHLSNIATSVGTLDNAISGAGFNITQFGGASVPIGAGTESTAVRVTLPTDGTGQVGIAAASYSASATFTPAAASHTAGDSNGTAQEFAFSAPSGGRIMITSSTLEIDGGTAEATAWRLYLFNVTPPSALADDAPFTLPSGDRTAHLGFVDLGTAADLGDTQWVESNGINKQIKLSGTSVFGYLVNLTTLTPANVAHIVTLHAIKV